MPSVPCLTFLWHVASVPFARVGFWLEADLRHDDDDD